jgi:hypothetical protein
MLTLLFSLRNCFRTRAALQAEILALRHQLLVLQRSNRGRKLRLSWADRVLWVWLSRLWNDWRSALLIVKPETVIAWHRKKPHLDGRGCIFSKSPIVQVVAFPLVFGAGADPGAVRLR